MSGGVNGPPQKRAFDAFVSPLKLVSGAGIEGPLRVSRWTTGSVIVVGGAPGSLCSGS
jgi:hypothetical protein